MFRDTHHGKPCKYCARPMHSGEAHLHPTRDHVNPRKHGGGAVVVACATCNTIKADLKPKQWAAFMEANPSWWLLTRRELRNAKRKLLGLPIPRRDRRARGPAIAPYRLIMPEFFNGNREKGDTHTRTAMGEALAPLLETSVLET